MLFGEHAVVYGHPCIVAAVDHYLTVEVEKSPSNKIQLPPELKTSRFVTETLNEFGRRYQLGGVKIKTDNGFSSHYGFGSSAAVTAATAKALNHLFKLKLNNKQLFDLCYRVILKIQKVGSGFDVAASLYRGVVYFVTGGKTIIRLPIKKLPLVVGYSGVKADTVVLVKQVAKLKPQKLFLESAKIVKQARPALEQGHWAEAGELMNKSQEILRRIGVSTPKLERLIDASLKAGAWGVKLSGAGGGDCMIALTPPARRRAIEQAITQAGGEVLRVKLAL